MKYLDYTSRQIQNWSLCSSWGLGFTHKPKNFHAPCHEQRGKSWNSLLSSYKQHPTNLFKWKRGEGKLHLHLIWPLKVLSKSKWHLKAFTMKLGSIFSFHMLVQPKENKEQSSSCHQGKGNRSFILKVSRPWETLSCTLTKILQRNSEFWRKAAIFILHVWNSLERSSCWWLPLCHETFEHLSRAELKWSGFPRVECECFISGFCCCCLSWE